MKLEMNDLTSLARKVDEAKTLPEAQTAMKELIDSFKFKGKKPEFKEFVNKSTNINKLRKWAWDLVLRGDDLQVVKL